MSGIDDGFKYSHESKNSFAESVQSLSSASIWKYEPTLLDTLAHSVEWHTQGESDRGSIPGND